MQRPGWRDSSAPIRPATLTRGPPAPTPGTTDGLLSHASTEQPARNASSHAAILRYNTRSTLTTRLNLIGSAQRRADSVCPVTRNSVRAQRHRSQDTGNIPVAFPRRSHAHITTLAHRTSIIGGPCVLLIRGCSDELVARCAGGSDTHRTA